MSKKKLKKRIEALEHELHKIAVVWMGDRKRIQDLEEIVFEVDLCESTQCNEPDRSFN